MGGREILTLQFGHYSNFVGTHWWNIQEQGFEYAPSALEEIDHDVLYREGITTQRQVTFTPRLLLVDLHGSLGALPERSDLYEPPLKESQVNVEWDNSKVEVRKREGIAKNEFQSDLEDPEPSNKTYDLEADVKVWSDFLYAKFHPRTVNVVRQYKHCDEHSPFDSFPLGSDLWKSEFGEDFSDKIRNYVEECDGFQGFHILADSYNAFAGLTSACLEHLGDEYDKKSVLVCPLIPSYFDEVDADVENVRSARVLNYALFFNELGEHSDLFVPLSLGSKGWRQPGLKREFSHLVYNANLPYHSSAILATTLETLTMKYRLKSSTSSLIDVCTDLTRNGRKAVAASVSLPFPVHERSDLLEVLDKWDGPLTIGITPSCQIGADRLMQYMTLRGLSEDRLKKPMQRAGKQRELPAYRCDDISEMLQMYLSYSTHATATNVTVVHKPVKVKTPFPKIFDQYVGRDGNICESTRLDTLDVESVPILAGLHSGSEIGEMLESLHTEARRIRISKFPQFVGSGMEKDDFEQSLDNLFSFRENYEDNYFL